MSQKEPRAKGKSGGGKNVDGKINMDPNMPQPSAHNPPGTPPPGVMPYPHYYYPPITHMRPAGSPPPLPERSSGGFLRAIVSSRALSVILVLVLCIEFPLLMFQQGVIEPDHADLVYDNLNYKVGSITIDDKHSITVDVYLTNMDRHKESNVRLDIWAINTTIQDRNIADDMVSVSGKIKPRTTGCITARMELPQGTFNILVKVFEDDEDLNIDARSQISVP